MKQEIEDFDIKVLVSVLILTLALGGVTAYFVGVEKGYEKGKEAGYVAGYSDGLDNNYARNKNTRSIAQIITQRKQQANPPDGQASIEKSLKDLISDISKSLLNSK